MNELEKIFNITVDEKYLELVPRPTIEEYKSLRDSITMEGQKDPIVVNSSGVILDGYTRYEICQALGKEVRYRIEDFKSKEDEEYYVIECNLNRRQLNAFQKVELSRKLYEDIRKQLKQRSVDHARSHAPDKQHLNWRKELSKRIGVGENQCQQAMAIINSKREDLILNLREGKIKVEEAYLTLKGKTPNIRSKGLTLRKHRVECPMCHHKMTRDELIKI